MIKGLEKKLFLASSKKRGLEKISHNIKFKPPRKGERVSARVVEKNAGFQIRTRVRGGV